MHERATIREAMQRVIENEREREKERGKDRERAVPAGSKRT